jgi:hypothetical protein
MLPFDIRRLLCNAVHDTFWWWREMFDFLAQCGLPEDLLQYEDKRAGGKAQTMGAILDELSKRGEAGRRITVCIVRQMANWAAFDADAANRGGPESVRKLREGLAAKRWLEQQDRDEATRRAAELRQPAQEAARRVAELRDHFYRLLTSVSPQARGYEFEQFLLGLFRGHDLEVVQPFRTTGQQIDGAVAIDSHSYLLEARWRDELADAGDLFEFQGKVQGKFDGSRGLFISVNGFAPQAVDGFRPGQKSSIVLATGEDIMCVLDDRIDLLTMLRQKIRLAETRGYILVRAADLI